ncbi:MAG: Hpt domain-containing protein [Candidatus Krumholzibacteriia bacterium]
MNITQLAGDLELDDEEYRSILELFVETSRSDLAAIKTAVAHGDATAACRAAHSLKGAAANLGLSDMSSTAHEIEEKSRASRLHETHETVLSLEEHLAAVERLLDGKQATDGAKVPKEIMKK